MASYYKTIVLPARVRAPKDKPTSEGTVNDFITNIIARMRNYQFFTIDEYNAQLLIKLDKINKKPFQKMDGSRQERFDTFEKSCLQPLPPKPYELAQWRIAKVQNNSHVSYNKCYYSVPFEHIGKRIKLRITENTLQIYNDLKLLCEHKLIEAGKEYYSTNPDHMPPHSNAANEWNRTRYTNWAKLKETYVYEVVKKCFNLSNHEQQHYKTVHSIIKLADKYSDQRLNYACKLALEHMENPNYSHIKGILSNNQDLIDREENANDDKQESKSRFFKRRKIL